MGGMSSTMPLHELSQFYRHFAELDQAGITYAKCFDLLKKNEKSADKILQMNFMIEHLKRGRSLSDGLKFVKLVPAFDIPLIKAAEDSGRIVEVLKNLSKKYDVADMAAKSIRSQLFKPYFTLVVALFVPTFPDYFMQKVTLFSYLKNSLGILGVISAAAFGMYHLWQKSFYDLEKAKLLHVIQGYLPFFRGLAAKIALEKFARAFGMMLDSGMDLFDSLTQASLCSADSHIASSVNRIIPQIRSGKSLGQCLQAENFFPLDLVTAMNLGTESGKLPEFLKRYSDGLKLEIDRKIQLAVKAIPIVMYWVVTAYVAFTLVKFYKGHLDEVVRVLETN